MKSEVGPPVDGDRFFNRTEELKLLEERIYEHKHTLMSAPRRIGKTSLMLETARRLAASYSCVHVDFQRCHTAGEAVAAIAVAMRKHLGPWQVVKTVFANAFTGLKRVDTVSVDVISIKLRDHLGQDWRPKAVAMFEALAGIDKPVVLFLDEISILVNRMLKGPDFCITDANRQRTDAFMSWLRSMAERHQTHVRMVLAGSIGLEPVLSQGGLSGTLSPFTPFEVGPWSDVTAVACLHELSKRYRVEYRRGATERMTELLGSCIPHHVQMFFWHVYEDCRHRDEPSCEVADVERVYKDRLLGSRSHAELSHYEERLSLMLGRDVLPFALDLLTETAVTGKLTSQAANIVATDMLADPAERASTLRNTLAVLEHDGYVQRTAGNYVFVSSLLRDWWKMRHEFAFKPAAKRALKS